MYLPLRKIKEWRLKRHVKKFGSKNNGFFNYFNKKWFEKHQGILLWLLNHKILKYWFRWTQRIHRDRKWNERIVWFMPNFDSVFKGYDKNGNIILETCFRTHQKFSKRIYYAFRPLWWMLHGLDHVLSFIKSFIPELEFSFNFDVLTVYPDADPETSTVDGYVLHTETLTWTNLRNATGADSNDYLGSGYGVVIDADITSGLWWTITRSIFLFNTTLLTEEANISGVTLSIFGTSKNDGLGISPNIDIYTSTPTSNTSLVSGDYTQIGTVSQTGSPIDYNNFNANGYNNFVFNATGRNNVNKTGVSKFGARNQNYDVINNTPTWVWDTDRFGFIFADNPGASQDPKLTVEYTLPVTATPLYHGKPGLQTSGKTHGKKGL